ncbi:MAG: YgiQ family radical SAM protein, partial [Spirochaetes bacterium]|nr:YgiQ family radical SAM protein [Spirochaetota bacterium]
KPFFKGTITDVGGPTANMYGLGCKIGWCEDPHCLVPEICKNLMIDRNVFLDLLKKIRGINGVKHVFVSSGIRYDLALLKPEETEWIIRFGTSGHFKVAPEHCVDEVLRLMRKPPNRVFIDFIHFFEKIKKQHHMRLYLLPYIILSHPGSDNHSIFLLKKFLKRYHLKTFQVQDFTPTPQTLSTAMYFAEMDEKKNKLIIPKVSAKRNDQRKIFENKRKGKD